MAAFLGLAGGMGGWFVADESIGLIRSVVRFEDRIIHEHGTSHDGYDPVEIWRWPDSFPQLVSRRLLKNRLRQRRRLFDAMTEAFGGDEAERFFRSDG